MKNLLFTHSYFLRRDPKQWAGGQPYAPLGTMYAAAFLRENGYNVAMYDPMFAKDTQDLQQEIINHCASVIVIYDDGFNYLTKMCLTNMRLAAFEMIQIAKENKCSVIVCSSDAADHYELYLQQGADFIIIGEGEITLLELLNDLNEGGQAVNAIAGLAFLQNGKALKTLPRSVLKDLDSLPFPAWDLIDIEMYRKVWMKSTGYFSINMVTTRGCPYKCNWCAKPIYGNRYNSRSPGNVVAEIKFLLNRNQFSHIWFCDDIFGLKPSWVKEFAVLLQNAGIKISFKIQARADLLSAEDYVQALAQSGCENAWMGAESGSQKILDAMDKGITVEQIYTAAKNLRDNNIKPSLFIQFGYPGETKTDIQRTIQMIHEIMPADIGISVSYPLPGTKFFEKVKNELGGKSNWSDSNEMAMMFKNQYPPAFYKQLHRYVHLSFRHKMARRDFKTTTRNFYMDIIPRVKKAISISLQTILLWQAQRKLNALESVNHQMND